MFSVILRFCRTARRLPALGALLLLLCSPGSLLAAFVHPGGLHTQADLDRMKTQVAAGAHPWIDDWNLLIQDPLAQYTYAAKPLANMGTSRQAADLDAHAAYLNAIRWYISGDTRYADCAVNILNAWAKTVNQVPTGADTPGLIAIPIQDFALAGEVLRIYPGWQPADFAAFQGMFANYLYPVVNNFLTNHNGQGPTHYWTNWDACNLGSLIAMGVLCDNQAWFDQGVTYFQSGVGAGCITNAVPYEYKGNLYSGETIGQWQESGRDQAHSQLGLGLLGYACQTAWNQGVDLFSYAQNRFLAGAEYVAQYNLWHEVPYTQYVNSDPLVCAFVARNKRGQYGDRPVYELLYNHYAVSGGLSTPNVKAMAELERPEGGSNDHFGYGTLTFTQVASASPYPVVAPPPVPTGLTATAGVGTVWLSWTPPAGDAVGGYNVLRATTSGGPYTVIVSATTSPKTLAPQYTDTNVTNGTTYYYVVQAANASGTSASSSEVSALPVPSFALGNGWADQDIGAVTTPGSASCSVTNGNTFIVSGSGSDVFGTADQLHYAYQSVSGDYTFIGRIAAQTLSGSNGDKVGLMMRESLDPGSKHVFLVFYQRNSGEADLISRATTGGSSTSVTGPGMITTPLWFKLARSGSTFTGSVSVDGANWVTAGTATVDMASTYFAGVAVCSRSKTGVLTTATVDNVSSLTALPNPPVITSASAASGTVGSAFTYQITATGSPSNYAASGLPAGLAVDSATGVITGTPSASGTYHVTLSATNTSGAGTAALTITINPAVATNGTWKDQTSSGITPLTLNLTFAANSSSIAYAVATTSPPPATPTPVVGDALRVNTTTGNFSNGNAYYIAAVNTTAKTLQLASAPGGAAITATTAGTSVAPIYMRWNDAVNWVGGTIANGYGAVATIGNLPSNVRIALAGNWIVGTINFTGGGGSDLDITGYDYATTAGGSITFATGTSTTPLFSVARNATFPLNMGGARYIRVAGNQGLEVMSSSDATTGSTVSWRPQSGIDWSKFSGDLQLRQGRLDVQAGNVLPSTSDVVLGNANTTAGRFAVMSMFSGRNQVIGALSGTSVGRLSAGTSSSSTAGSPVTVTIGGNNGSGTFAGVIGADAAGSSLNTTPISIVKNGTGTEVFSGANLYTGTTTVNAGTFLLNGSLVGPVVVNAGTFGGSGSTSNTVTVGTGTGSGAGFAPGNNAIGTFTTTGALTLRSDATLALECSPSTDTADMVVAGGVTLNNAILSPSVVGQDAAISGGTVLTIIRNTSSSPVNGSFNGLPEGATVSIGANAFQISYVGGDGNDVTLTALGAAQPPVITSTAASGAFGGSFSFAVVASNTPTSFSATGLPAGLTINPTTGVISGTPLAAGTFTAMITATNAAGSTTAPLTISIPQVIGLNLRAYNTYGLNATDVAGVIRATYWNNLVGPAATGETVATSTLTDNLGLPVNGMTVTYTAGTTGGSYTNSGTLKFGADAVTVNPATNDPNLYSSAFDQYDGTASTLSVTGIPYSNYDLIVYVYDGGAGQGGVITANGQTLAIRGGVGNPDVNGNGYVQSTDSTDTAGPAVQQGNYVRFSGLSGDLTATFLATNMSASTLRLKIAGFQILGNDATPAPTSAPAAPATLTASGGNTQVALNWSYAATATSYHIYKDGALLATVASPMMSYADTAVTNGTAYSYTVSAVNSIGEGAASQPAVATPAAPSFTMPQRTVYQYSVPMAPVYGSWPYDPQRRAYLWIPPGCTKVQGVVLGLHNMLEKPMFDDPVIRQACADANLAIVFISPGDSKTWTPNGVGNYKPGHLTTAIDLDPGNYVSADINPATGTNYATDINPATGTRFANQTEQAGAEVAALLRKLATESGYAELQYAPILLTGHSAASPFVWTRGLATTAALTGRVFGILPYKGFFPGSIPDGIPVFHTASEWQEISSWGNTWELGDSPALRGLRAGGTNKLLSSFIQPGTGHYEYAAEQSGPLGLFIKKAAQYRIPANWAPTGYPTLNAIDPTTGYLVDVTKVGSGHAQPVAYADWVAAGKDPLRAYWYFDREMAQAVCDDENAGFSKLPQMINGFQNATTLAPLASQANGIGYAVVTATLLPDGVSFKVQAASVNQSPIQRLYNGRPLGMPTGSIAFRANGSGAMKQVGVDTFRVWMDRGTVIKEGQPWEPFIIARQPGDANYRSADRPLAITTSVPVNNINGAAQTITFPTIPDQINTNLQPITLNATASSGLPVQYWVVSGPYRNDENNSAVLIPDQLPAKPTYPIHVIVGAWQWGQPNSIAAATPVYQQFDIVTPPPIPAAPAGLTATATGPEFTLAWSASPNATSYSVKRAATSGGPYATLATGLTGTSYLDVSAAYGTTYYYVVSATDVSGESPDSREVSATATSSQANGTWTQAGTTTNYNDAGNWSNGIAASGVGAVATMAKAGPTIVLNTDATVGALTGTWASGASMNLSGAGSTLTLATTSGAPTFSFSNWFSRYDYISNLNFAGNQGLTYVGKSNVLVLQAGVTWNGFSGPFTIAPNTDGSMVYAQNAQVLPPVDLTLTPGTGTNGYRNTKLILNGGADQTIGALNSTVSSTATSYVANYSGPSLLTGSAPGGTNNVGFATLTLGAGNGSGNFQGKIGTGFNNSANTEDPTASLIDIVKIGTGTQILSGADNYVGATTVSAGTLLVNGTHAPSGLGVLGTYDVSGTLGGAGTIRPSADSTGPAMITIESSGALQPGGADVDTNNDKVVDAAGATLTLDQSASQRGVLAFAVGAHLRLTLGASVTSTQVAIVGQAASAVPAVTFNGTVVDVADLTGGGLSPGQYIIAQSDGAGSYAGLIVAADGTITGGLTLGAGMAAYPGSSLKVVENAIVIALAPPAITSPATATGTYGVGFNYAVTATESPTSFAATGLPGGLALDPASGIISGTPSETGTFPVAISATNAGGTGTAVLQLTIQKAAATVVLGNLSQVYDGTTKTVSATTVPAGLTVDFSYSTPPLNAGQYTVTGTVSDPNYFGSADGVLIVTKAAPNIAVTGYSVTYDRTAHTATGAASGVQGETLAGLDLSGTTHTNGGVYQDPWSFTDVTGNYTNALGSVIDTIAKAPATVTLSPLTQWYDGTPRVVAAATEPTGLTVDLTYNGLATAPIYPGQYDVVGTVDDPNYTGFSDASLNVRITALARHVSRIDGSIDGSLQVLSADGTALNGTAWVSGDLLAAGTPDVVLNGQPTFAGTIQGDGSADPTGYVITLDGGTVLRHVVCRVDPLALPTVLAPAAPTGTRDVTLNSASQRAGDFSTVRDLTLNGNAGTVAVPPGTYGQLTANGTTAFVLGHAGATEPEVYGLQGLRLNGASSLYVVGPVVLIVATPVTVNGTVGAATHPEWLSIQVASGGVTANGHAVISGDIVAPTGTVMLNGGATVTGQVSSDALIINGTASLKQPAL